MKSPIGVEENSSSLEKNDSIEILIGSFFDNDQLEIWLDGEVFFNKKKNLQNRKKLLFSY